VSVGASIYTILHGFKAVANIVGTRIYPGTIPQDATMPALVYNVITGSPENIMDGVAPGDHELIQIDAWAVSTNSANGYDIATTLRDAARAAFEVQSTLITAGVGAKVTAFYPDVFEPDTRRFSRSIGLSVWSAR